MPETRTSVALGAVTAANQARARLEACLTYQCLPFMPVGLGVASVLGPDNRVGGFVAENLTSEASGTRQCGGTELDHPLRG